MYSAITNFSSSRDGNRRELNKTAEDRGDVSAFKLLIDSIPWRSFSYSEDVITPSSRWFSLIAGKYTLIMDNLGAETEPRSYFKYEKFEVGKSCYFAGNM